jgi:F-type H+-transporting ATPase subunit b
MAGFGINTNVLETNVLNLSVVVGVLFVLGKDVLTSLLDERREKIVQSLEDVETRYKEAQKKLEEANLELSTAMEKAKEIRAQSTTTASQSFAVAEKRAEAEILRLQGTKTSTISVEKQKLVGEMRELLTTGALEKAFATLKKERSSAALQKRFIDNLLSDVFSEKNVIFE